MTEQKKIILKNLEKRNYIYCSSSFRWPQVGDDTEKCILLAAMIGIEYKSGYALFFENRMIPNAEAVKEDIEKNRKYSVYYDRYWRYPNRRDDKCPMLSMITEIIGKEGTLVFIPDPINLCIMQDRNVNPGG